MSADLGNRRNFTQDSAPITRRIHARPGTMLRMVAALDQLSWTRHAAGNCCDFELLKGNLRYVYPLRPERRRQRSVATAAQEFNLRFPRSRCGSVNDGLLEVGEIV